MGVGLYYSLALTRVEQLTTPKDKEGNHFTSGDTDMSGDMVG
jgi:hypothetical protein